MAATAAAKKTEGVNPLWEEVATLFDKDYETLDAGEPFAFFSFIRLSNLYGVACICYYEYDFSPVEDHIFDGLCHYLLEFYDQAMEAGVWGGIAGVLDREMLKAGSGYHCKSFRLPLHNIAFYVIQATARRKYAARQAHASKAT